MGSRVELQNLLEATLGSGEVYFQPPPTVRMVYPAIIFERSYIKTAFADNNPYSLDNQYTVTIIDRNPDSIIPGKLALLPKCRFDRHFTADNLNHDVFVMYF